MKLSRGVFSVPTREAADAMMRLAAARGCDWDCGAMELERVSAATAAADAISRTSSSALACVAGDSCVVKHGSRVIAAQRLLTEQPERTW
jgi:hypothetical protein